MRPSAGTRGFTLFEILLGLALLALLGGAFIGASSHLLSERPATPRDAFLQAVSEARKAALTSRHATRLLFEGERKQFLIFPAQAPGAATSGEAGDEIPLKSIPLPRETGDDLTVSLLGPATQGGGAMLIGGVLMESRLLPHVVFHPDGTCQPFRAQFVRAGSRSTLAIDPWTCAPMLSPADHASAP